MCMNECASLSASAGGTVAHYMTLHQGTPRPLTGITLIWQKVALGEMYRQEEVEPLVGYIQAVSVHVTAPLPL